MMEYNTLIENEYILMAEGVRKSFGKHEILKNINLKCKKGNCIGIVGVNGSGKSTLLSIIAGGLKPDAGSVSAFGVNLLKNKNLISRYIGYVPQENPLIEDMTVRDNLRLWYCDGPCDLDWELEQGFLRTLGIGSYQRKTVKKLSGGMKKRVSIAVALHNKPGILLLDEPSAALDLIAKKAIRDYLDNYRKGGGTVIIVTHDEEELDMCDKVYVVSGGILKEADRKLRGEELLKLL